MPDTCVCVSLSDTVVEGHSEGSTPESELRPSSTRVCRDRRAEVEVSRPFGAAKVLGIDASGPERVAFEVDLDGQHLSPIFIELSAEKLAESIPAEALNSPAAPFLRDLRFVFVC